MTQNVSKCLKTSQLSLLGSAVAGVYYCMGLRSMSIAPRSCLLLRSDPSIVNFNSEGSLVIRLAAIVSINGLSGKIIIALIGKNRLCPQFLLFHSCLLVIPQSDMNFWDFFLFFFEIRKVTNLNLTKILLFPTCCLIFVRGVTPIYIYIIEQQVPYNRIIFDDQIIHQTNPCTAKFVGWKPTFFQEVVVLRVCVR